MNFKKLPLYLISGLMCFSLCSCEDDEPIDGGNNQNSDTGDNTPSDPGDSTPPSIPTDTSFTVTWKDEKGNVIRVDEDVPYGTTPENDYTFETYFDRDYIYEFDGWNPAISPISSDVTYTAKTKNTVNDFVVTWKNGDDVLEQEHYKYGQMPSYKHDDPTKACADEDKCYYFVGWDKDFDIVTEDIVYNAKYYLGTKVIVSGNYITGFDTTGNDIIIPVSYGSPSLSFNISTNSYYDSVTYNGRTYFLGTTSSKLRTRQHEFNFPEDTKSIDASFLNSEFFMFLEKVTIPLNEDMVLTGLFFDNKDSTFRTICTEYSDGYYLGNEENPYFYFMRTKDNSKTTFEGFHEDCRVICSYAFANSKVENLAIPGHIKTVNENAFSNNYLKTITFEEGVKRIDKDPVYPSSKITAFSLPNSLEKFVGWSSSPSFSSSLYTKKDNLSYFGNQTNPYLVLMTSEYECTAQEFVVEDGCRFALRFSNSSYVKTVRFPSSVRYIGSYCAATLTKLTTIEFSEGLEEIAEQGFYIGSGTPPTISEVRLPNSLKRLGYRAFYKRKISKIVIGDSLETIEAYAFYDSGCTDLTLGKSVKTVDEQAFYRAAVDYLSFPDSMRNVKKNAFQGTSMYSLDCGKFTQNIEKQAFNDCKINFVKLPYTMSKLADGALLSVSKVCRLEIGIYMENMGDISLFATAWLYEIVNKSALTVDSPGLSSWAAKAKVVNKESKYRTIQREDKLIQVFYEGNNGDVLVQVISRFVESSTKIYLDVPEGVSELNGYCFDSLFKTPYSVTLPSSLKKIDGYAFYTDYFRSINTLSFSGTKAQWNEVELEEYWAEKTYGGSAFTTISCSDGDITL